MCCTFRRLKTKCLTFLTNVLLIATFDLMLGTKIVKKLFWNSCHFFNIRNRFNLIQRFVYLCDYKEEQDADRFPEVLSI